MQEKTLTRIVFFIALAGLMLLFILSKTIALPQSPVLVEDESYLVKGEIDRITQRDAVTYIDLHVDDQLTVVLFKRYPVDLHQGDFIEVSGKASKDQTDALQFIGKEIRIIK